MNTHEANNRKIAAHTYLGGYDIIDNREEKNTVNVIELRDTDASDIKFYAKGYDLILQMPQGIVTILGFFCSNYSKVNQFILTDMTLDLNDLFGIEMIFRNHEFDESLQEIIIYWDGRYQTDSERLRVMKETHFFDKNGINSINNLNTYKPDHIKTIDFGFISAESVMFEAWGYDLHVLTPEGMVHIKNFFKDNHHKVTQFKFVNKIFELNDLHRYELFFDVNHFNEKPEEITVFWSGPYFTNYTDLNVIGGNKANNSTGNNLITNIGSYPLRSSLKW